jgi:hypothetical protein
MTTTRIGAARFARAVRRFLCSPPFLRLRVEPEARDD